MMAIGAFLVLLGSLRCAAWRQYRRSCLLLVLAVALGPGLLVNGLLQPLWGRPRPRHIEQFAGTQRIAPGGSRADLERGKVFPRDMRLWGTSCSLVLCSYLAVVEYG